MLADIQPRSLASETVSLRPLAAEDEARFLRTVQDPEVTARMDGALALDLAQGLFAKILSAEAGAPRIWAITLPDGAYAGHAGFVAGEFGVELLFVLDRPHWGRGIASEVARILAEFALGEVGLERIVATVDDDHAASIRVLEKAAFRCEQVLDDEGLAYRVYARERPATPPPR